MGGRLGTNRALLTTFHRGVLAKPPALSGRCKRTMAVYAGAPGRGVTAEGGERPSQALDPWYSFTDSRQALWGLWGSNLLRVSIRSF